MSDIIYLRIVGEQQGVISEGCGSEKSVGNRFQNGHEDEIFVFSLRGAVSSTPDGVNHHGIQFCKTIDKSSPLFTQAINNNERCSLDFTFYRINRWGRWEKYYHIEARGASVSAYSMHVQLQGLVQEFITINYDYICSKHLIANTEFSALLTPENYNKLFPAMPPPIVKPEESAKKQEITLTIGVFFDGTGNNLLNTNLRMQKCSPENYGLDTRALVEFSQRCIKKEGFEGAGAGSYLNYYTNIYWLYGLYRKDVSFINGKNDFQGKIYVEGIGTENNKADSLIGMGLGNNDTGVIAKTDKAISLLINTLIDIVKGIRGLNVSVKCLQFDVFGFSRGAAAARHFTNRVFEEDYVFASRLKTVFAGIEYSGKPAGEVRFLGLFDTVTAVGGLVDGFDPHDGNNLGVKLALAQGVAKNVFHLTAMHECRYNFCLNSIKEQWPELSLPGAHADIGGGYNPLEEEYLFLTRPEMQSVPVDTAIQSTDVYRAAAKEAELLHTYPVLTPILPSGVLKIETDIEESLPPDQYHNAHKRVAAAVTFRRTISNDWSKVTLRVMYEVAKDAGVIFDDIEGDRKFTLLTELKPISEKAIFQAKTAVNLSLPAPFSAAEINTIGKYIHASANWNAVDYHAKHPVASGVSSLEMLRFVNRPDDGWDRTIYNMSGVEFK
jgi:type VI secretion system effector, Hcp1 family